MVTNLFFIAMMILACSLHQSASADELTESDKKLIEWFDTLGYPDLSELPVVNVATGQWSQSADGLPENRFMTGLLLTTEGDKFTIVGLDCNQLTFTKTDGAPPHETVSYLEQKIDVFVDEFIKEVEQDPGDRWRRFGADTSEAFELVVLGRACAAKGFNQRAHQLFELAGTSRDIPRQGDEPKLLLEYLKKDQAHTRMWRAVVVFGDPKISLEELLPKFEFIVETFPKTEYLERAQKTAAMLKQMIEEDKQHAQKEIPPLEKLTGQQRVTELIYQLRTQNGHQWSQPGSCNIFNDERGKNSPADLLVAEGFDAVPQLIKALDDYRFTRSVGYHRDFYFSHHVLRVNDCCERILSKIAGRGFYQRTHTNGAMAKDGKTETTKDRIQEWWSEVSSKGEKQVLIDAVTSGSPNAANQASVLVKKYPEEAVQAIKIGLPKVRTWDQQRMVDILFELRDQPAASELIKDQLVNATKLDVRLQAARALVKYDESKKLALEKLALERMLYEWENYKPENDEDQLFNDPKASLAKFLLSTGSAEGISTITESFEKLTTKTKFSILESVSVLPALTKENQNAIEKLLVDCLLITNEETRMSGSRNGQSFTNPRLCDMAGFVLTSRWPGKYACRLDGTELERDQNRFAAINRWREDNRFEPIDFPPPFEVAPVPADKTDPLVDRIVASKSVGEGKTAFAQLAGLGPGAIEAVGQVSRRIDDSHPFADQIKQLRIDMPNTITVLKIETNSANVPEDWQTKIESLKGKFFTSQLITEHLIEFAKQRPCAGVRLKAIRDGEGNGVLLQVDLTAEPAARDRSGSSWRTSKLIKLGNKAPYGTVGNSSRGHVTSLDSYQEMKKNLEPALAESKKHMRVVVSITADQQ